MVVEASEEQCEIHQVALSNLDGDGPQYITSNTLDEAGHATFLNAYPESRGAEPVNFTHSKLRMLQPDSHQSW
jgi:hypothetical protein